MAWQRSPWILALDRHVRSLQRNLPRRVVARVRTFPPIPPGNAGASLVVLCEADKFLDGLWSAWSWMRFLHPHLRLRLFVDGALPPSARHDFERLFPGAELQCLADFLTAQPAPSRDFTNFLAGYRFAKKLLLILHLQRSDPLLYSDCDVLAFRPPAEIIEAIHRGAPPRYMHDPGEPMVDPWLRQQARRLRLPLIERLNSGLLWIPKGSLDPAIPDALLEGWNTGVYNHFSEQTVFAVLLALAGGEALPEAEYRLSDRGMHFWERDLPCAELTVRHYVGLVRHRMYAHALPFIAGQATRR